MEAFVSSFVQADATKFPGGQPKTFSYGTAGFRDRADLLECCLFRAALVAALRSKCTNATIGVVITASHNPVQDNGAKFVDTKGQMMVPEWEIIASALTNAKSSELGDLAMSYVKQFQLDSSADSKPRVVFARDTRPSGEKLTTLLKEGLEILQADYTDYGLLTTPQLHYMVRCINTGGEYGTPTENGYYQKMGDAFCKLVPERAAPAIVKLDAANGVGAGRVEELNKYLGGRLKVLVYNDGTSGQLNYMCGADYVKATQLAPNGIPIGPGDRCLSFDGDADRIVYFYCTAEGRCKLLDGDKIASLMGMFIMEKLNLLPKTDLSIGLVQTAYANGNSTRFLENKLGIKVLCAKTGVKYLTRLAEGLDIGIFFEANGHGTVLYSDNAVKTIETAAANDQLASEGRQAACDLLSLIQLTSQTVGDSISDMLVVEAILAKKNWSCTEWDGLYSELPSRQMKVKVKDRQLVTTTDAERRCVTPPGLQEEVDRLVAAVNCGRAFVRPSGTEDVVRVYAEADSQVAADSLALDVCKRVYELAAGVGDIPSL